MRHSHVRPHLTNRARILVVCIYLTARALAEFHEGDTYFNVPIGWLKYQPTASPTCDLPHDHHPTTCTPPHRD